MPSLAQLLTGSGSLLVLDASSTRIQVGLLRVGFSAEWRHQTEEAGTGIFSGVESVLVASGCTLEQIGGFVFCEGPGSTLGIRTVAMAIRTWQVLRPRPAFAYQSLAVAGRLEWGKVPRPVTVIADARREAWHCLVTNRDGQTGRLERRAAVDLPEGELFTPECFRSWSPAPRPLTVCSYDLAAIFPALGEGDYFRAIAAPDAFQHAPPEYRKWSAQIHQAPTPTSR